MKAIQWCGLALASVVLAGCPRERPAEGREAETSNAAAAPVTNPTSPATAVPSDVTLTLDTPQVSTEITQGDRFGVTMGGTWQQAVTGAVYLQVSDSVGTLVAPAPLLAPKRWTYQIELPLPTSTPVGVYTGTLSVRACADSLCQQPYAGTAHSITYKVKVNGVGEWETLQRTSRHDGYVPVQIDATRYHTAWTWQNPTLRALSAVVTDGDNVYFSEPGDSPSVYAKRAIDGVQQWRRVFTSTYGFGPALAAPTVSNGVVYVATTAQEDSWVHALRASDGLQSYQSQFYTQWATILNPTVRNGKVYVNSGTYGGVVYAFNDADGGAAWSSSGGTYGMNTPAADDDFVYAYNGGTLDVFNARDGSLSTSIGPNSAGVQADYYGTPMLGSTDHVLAYRGTSDIAESKRQLLDYSVAGQAVRWMSSSLYSGYPAVAKGVVYATSNESYTFDALDEASGRVLWSWKPTEQSYNFIGNVVVTDNVAFVSTKTRIYAISLLRHRTSWSAATPGRMSISANRMLFVSAPPNMRNGRITAYRLD